MEYWTLKRNKHDKLVLLSMSIEVKYSYTQIPLTEEQARKTLKFSKDWKLVSNLHYDEYELRKGEDKYDILLNRFLELVKEHKNELEKPKTRKFTTDVDGTAKLVRTKDGRTIYVARRRNKKTGKIRNITEANAVCISDFDRDLFFRDCRSSYGMLPEGSIYKLNVYQQPDLFVFWSNFMDKEYADQLRRYDLKKLNKK